MQPTDERAGEARQVANRIDERDAAGCGGAGQEGRRQRPEDRQAAEDPEAGDRQRRHLQRRIVERVDTAMPVGRHEAAETRDGTGVPVLRSEWRAHRQMPTSPDDIRQRRHSAGLGVRHAERLHDLRQEEAQPVVASRPRRNRRRSARAPSDRRAPPSTP